MIALKEETTHILMRLRSALPSATFEMETFTRLADVVATRQVPTAAVECKHRPRLLINPDFVTEYCQRDEHLFLLVMHELMHVLLAHTSLYPRMTKAQNIAFDAIINATLMRTFNTPEYMGFFDAINPADKFPHLLLRPPVGWPHAPEYPPDTPTGTTRIMKQLYPKQLNKQAIPTFYEEVLALVREGLRQQGLLEEVSVILLGDHESPLEAYRKTFLKDVMGRVTKNWHLGIGKRGGFGLGSTENDWKIDASDAGYAVRLTFSRLLQQYINPHSTARESPQKRPVIHNNGRGVLPNPRDRQQHAKQSLGIPSLLWEQQTPVTRKTHDDNARAFIYLDVSGSMSDILPYLVGLMRSYVANGLAEIFQFSTAVSPLRLHELKQGIVKSTGGTNIACVMEHVSTQIHRVKRVMIVTDGYTNSPSIQDVAFIKQNRMAVCVVLPHESPYRDHLAPLEPRFVILPPLDN